MDTTASGAVFSYSLIALFVTALALFVGYTFWNNCGSVSGFADVSSEVANGVAASGVVAEGPIPPLPSKQAGGAEGDITLEREGVQAEGMAQNSASVEGFAGPAVGAGAPDCIRTSKDAAALYDLLSSKKVSTEEGPDDLREMKVILSKIACFKRDLLGAARVVEATRYQPFSTSHDLEPVAETCARCFSRTIPQRDLSLSLNKWGSRGTLLIKRLCTSENLSEAEEKEALRLFGTAMADLTDIALGQCCNAGDVKIGGVDGPRLVGGFVPAGTQTLKPYDGSF